MSDRSLPALGGKSFEELRRTNQHGAEYWSARDLQPLLGYGQWRRFEDAVKRAMTSCETSGNSAEHHFAGAGKPIIRSIYSDGDLREAATCKPFLQVRQE